MIDLRKTWDMHRIADEFGASLNTVRTAWRYSTRDAFNAHIDQHCATITARRAAKLRAAIGPFRQLTAGRWEAIAAEHGVAPLQLPRTALPLPDIMFAGRPGWTQVTMARWAVLTRRIDSAGEFKRASPPGRPVGVIETRPRRPRTEAAA